MTLVGPWERRSRELVYENAWIQVFHDEVTRPDGEPGVYGVVHPKTMAVGVVAIDDEDRVALVGQHRYTIDEYSWEIPKAACPKAKIQSSGRSGSSRRRPASLPARSGSCSG